MTYKNLKTKFIYSLSCLAAIAFVSGCSPLGAAVGAGAAVGVSAAQEGGVKGAVSDLKIEASISEKWFQYDLETFTKLSVTVDQGRVLLLGTVQDPEHRVEAVRLAWQVKGVKQVINEIRVADGEGLPGYIKDRWITTQLRTALTFDKAVQSINYSIDTVGGIVYLMGVSQNQAELNRVIEVARTIKNVDQVISYVKPLGEAVVEGSVPSSTTNDIQYDSQGSYIE